MDLSDFEEFEFAQNPVLGFCPDVNAPLRATIRRETDARYVFTISVFVEGDPLSGDCLGLEDGYTGEGCVVIQELPTRQLNSTEAQRVRDAFGTVGITWAVLPGPGIVCIAPCLIMSLQWDGMRLSDGLAGCVEAGQAYRVISSDELQEIVRLLQELR